MKRKLLEQVKLVPALVPVASQGAGSVNGVVVDRQGYLSAVVSAGVGAASGTPDSYSVTAKIQHGDKSDGSDMADADIALTALTADNTNTYTNVDLAGLKRYVRVVFTLAFTNGTSPKQFITGAVALGDANIEPAV